MNTVLEWMEKLLRSDETQGAVKRAATAAAMVVVPIANQKLHLDLSDTTVVGIISGLGLYMVQSVANTIHARSVAAKAPVTDVATAIAVLKGP
jgi:hypothetical protein